MMRLSRRGSALFALVGMFALMAASVAEARPGGRGSFGSRGSRTFDTVPTTRTAPSAGPVQRSQTQPSQATPGAAPGAQAAQQGGRRFGMGFLGGLLGAGLLGGLLGAGFFGGLGSLAGILGFLLQIALIVGAVMLVMRFIRSRQRQEPQPAYANAGRMQQPPQQPQPYRPQPAPGGMGRSALGGLMGGGSAAAGAAQSRERSDTVGIGPNDYGAFEATLQGVMQAYSREDVARLWELATPEVAGEFQGELNENAQKGVISEIVDVKLLQGDLAEAWREGATDYATVAMRFALTESLLDRATRRVVEGGRPEEIVEIWTFRRDAGGPWKLSAIQQPQ